MGTSKDEGNEALLIDGYDNLAREGPYDSFMAKSAWPGITAPYERRLAAAMPAGGRLVCLGSGSGRCTLPFVGKFDVIGYDLSAESVAAARKAAPRARFECADMCELDLAEQSVDGVIAPFSIFHVPRDKHPALLQSICSWLREGGVFWLVMGATDRESYYLNFLGQQLPFSHYDSRKNLELCAAAGLEVLNAVEESAEENGETVTFQFIEGRKR